MLPVPMNPTFIDLPSQLALQVIARPTTPTAPGPRGRNRALRPELRQGARPRAWQRGLASDEAGAAPCAMLAFRPLFDAHVELAEILTLGRTPLGERRVINILGGWFRG